MENIFDNFGENVFGDSLMREKLPKDVYDSLKNTMEQGCPLNENIANIIAEAMKEWAIDKGATHYSHWFQPMTGITAEKHECFLNPSQGGKIITKFRGKELIKGENDASSFPNGGIRATFEARGYTAWDPTSYAFIKDNTLCIPTAFCSYSGEALDKKTPLLRSMQAINKEAMRVLKLFNSSATHVNVTVGAEQEYFLIDKADFIARHDLVYCGRTLFGAMPPKGQELNDHYYGTIPTRVKDFMQDLDNELWKLGVLAKIEHNEVAPSQYELAPCYTTVNISTDQNQLTMELMRIVADRHNLACLLHEKPFANINGSGKHNNWSLSTDTGANLLEAGASPSDNAQFLLFFTAIIKAVDEYQDLLRVAVSSAGNDNRLGEHEAPPAIISVFIGEELLEILEAVEHGTKNSEKNKTYICIGVDTLPQFPKDSTDR
ncbi:MAG: glutamine synthetase III, partial [Clostridia bacterium]